MLASLKVPRKLMSPLKKRNSQLVTLDDIENLLKDIVSILIEDQLIDKEVNSLHSIFGSIQAEFYYYGLIIILNLAKDDHIDCDILHFTFKTHLYDI